MIHMQSEEYIIERKLVAIVSDICAAHGYILRKYSDDWVLAIEHGDKSGKIFGYKFGINNSASANIAQDKVACFEVLDRHNIPSMPHYLLRTKVGLLSVDIPGAVVLKPLVGTSGHMVQAFESVEDATRHAISSQVEAWTLSPRRNIAREMRFIVLDGDILLAYEKQEPTQNGNLSMFNLGRGAIPKDINPTTELVDLALQARRVLDLRVCAVDIVELASGELLVLEVNDGIMTEYYSRHSSENAIKARSVYESIIQKMLL